MSQFRSVPTYGLSIISQNRTSAPWYRFFQDLQNGRAPGPVLGLTLTASPFTYHATDGGGFLIVRGAGVTAIEFSRDQSTYFNIGATQGAFPMSNQDSYRITYGAAPTLTFVPQ